MSTSLLDYDDSRQYLTIYGVQTGAGASQTVIPIAGYWNIVSARWNFVFAASGQGLATAALTARANVTSHTDGSPIFSMAALKCQTGGGMNLTRWEPLFIRFFQAGTLYLSIVVSAGVNAEAWLTLEITTQ